MTSRSDRVKVGRLINGEWAWTWTGITDGGFLLSPEAQLARGIKTLDVLEKKVMGEKVDSPFKKTDVNADTKKVLGEQQTQSKEDPKGDVTAERTENQVVRGTIKPDKEG